MNIFLSQTSVEFEEPHLTSDTPACLPFIAAAMAAGFRLAKDGAANHIDALIGPKRIQDFKNAKRKDLRRVITWRFRCVLNSIEGEVVNVHDFLLRCRDDEAYMKAQTARANYHQWLDLLMAASKNTFGHLLVKDEDAHRRNLMVPLFVNREKEIVRRLAEAYENGF